MKQRLKIYIEVWELVNINFLMNILLLILKKIG